MIVKLEIQLLGEKTWNQKASQRTSATFSPKSPKFYHFGNDFRAGQLQAEEKISLKKYYESTDPNSLFESKGYSMKYVKHSVFQIRRTKLYHLKKKLTEPNTQSKLR